MVRSTNNVFIDEKNAQTNQPVYLYSIFDYDGSTDLHYTSHDANVTYDGQVYTKFGIDHDATFENTTGEETITTLTLQNVSRLQQALLEANDFRGKKVEIRKIWLNQLADTSAFIKDTYYIDGYSSNQNVVMLNLSTKFDVMNVILPLGSYMRNHCRWVFKGTECGYAGGDASCLKTKDDCKNNKNNYTRYGGFPSIPYRRIFAG